MLASAPKWTKSFLNSHTNTKGAHTNPKWAKSFLNARTNTKWSKSFLNAHTNTKRAHTNTKWAKSFLNAHTNNKYKVSQILPKCAHKYKKSAHTFKMGQILPKGAHKYGNNSCGNKKQEISSSKKSSSTVKMDEFNSINYAIPALGVKSSSFSNIDIWFNPTNFFHWLIEMLGERWRRGSVAGEWQKSCPICLCTVYRINHHQLSWQNSPKKFFGNPCWSRIFDFMFILWV